MLATARTVYAPRLKGEGQAKDVRGRRQERQIYAVFLSVFCRNTAAFFFCSSSNSRFNSSTIAISLYGSLSATASRQRLRQSFRASCVMDDSQSEIYTGML